MKVCLLFDRERAEETRFFQTDLVVYGKFHVKRYQINRDTIEFHMEVDTKETIWEIVRQSLEMNLPHGFGFSEDQTKRYEEAKRKLMNYHT